MGYSPWLWSFLGHFHTFLTNMYYFSRKKDPWNLAPFEQKAYAIAHGFDRFWVIFTPFEKIWIISHPFKNCHFGHFWARSMGYSHGFDRFWVIFTPLEKIWIISHPFNMYYFSSKKNPSNLATSEQKAWAIAHGFDRFWVIFTPFWQICIIFQGRKIDEMWEFLSKKHGL